VPDSPSPLETALDLLVYAPVGAVLTLSEEVPRLAAKGRSRVEGQIAVARMVGRLAVGQGRRMMAGTPRPGSPPAPTSPPATPPGPDPSGPPNPTRPTSTGPASTGPASTGRRRDASRPSPQQRTAGSAVRIVPTTGEVPEVSTLAIPGYDSLSASQVVQRLVSLGPDELDAIGRYEAGGRGRRTILARIAQLQDR